MTFKKLTKTIPLKMCFMLTIINLKYGLATQQGHNFSSFYEKAFLKIHFLHKFFFGGGVGLLHLWLGLGLDKY